VVHRFANEMYPREKGEPNKKFRVWIGFSTDELRRVRMIGGKWQNWYPLIDHGLNRSDCIALVERAGLPTPPRSACWMCPNRHDREWNHLKTEQPGDFKKAVAFEKELQAKWPHLWLHKEKKPLDQIIFTDGTDDMFSGCNSGMCMV